MCTTCHASLTDKMKRTELPADSAERKAREAERHLKGLGEALGDQEAFEDHLSAFLSAARSVIDFLRTEYSKVKGFRVWMRGELRRLHGDVDVGFMFRKRILVVHVQYPTTNLEGEVSYAVDVVLVDGAHIERVHDGEVVESRDYAPPPKEPQTEGSPTVTHRRFFADRPDEDVVSLCRAFLDRLRQVVEEAETLSAKGFLGELVDDDPLEAFRLLF